MKKMEEELQQKGIVVSTYYMRHGRKWTREESSSQQLATKKQRHQEERRWHYAEVSVKRDVLDELRVLESKHAFMVLRVSKTFRDDVYDLKFYLASVLADRELEDCDSEGKIFILIQAYISRFNNSVLRITVERFDKEPAMKSIKEYEEEKVQFLESTTVREFESAIKERSQPEQPDDQEVIELKIPDRDGTWPDRTLKDLLDLVNEVYGTHGRETVMITTAGNSLSVRTYIHRNKVEEVKEHIHTALIAAPFTGGASLAAAAGAGAGALMTAWLGAEEEPKVNAAQQTIDEDIKESRRLNRELAEAGWRERVNESDLTLNLKEDTVTIDNLRALSNSLRSGQSKADMEELLNTPQ